MIISTFAPKYKPDTKLMNIAVLLSGGVDSSVVVHQLCEQGFTPDLFYIRIGMDNTDGLDCSAEEDIELSTAIARRYGLNFNVIDLHKQYWERVITYALDKIKYGLTPNPDVMCNKLIKFGCFEEEAGYLYDKTATGHYATIREIDGKTWLGTAKDKLKDQTDFLAQINYLQVSKLLFPIGNLLKSEVRDIALKSRLPSAYRRDSQGICFLGKINFTDFLDRFLGHKKGRIVELETGRILGTHKGYWFHTIGQRKGLGLSGGPWYVVDKDIHENVVYISRRYDAGKQFSDNFRLNGFHFISGNPWADTVNEIDVAVKIRHSIEFIPAKIYLDQDDNYLIRSTEMIRGICPGQFGVVYDKDSQICIGSGEIRL